ncbi:MAG TPA: TRAP transporter permease [Bacillota bacterium]|nr:TRAP transporter permease [Bacillota bacterium]
MTKDKRENIDRIELTEEEQEELLRQYDAESNTRNLTGTIAIVVYVLLISFSLFQIYTGAFGAYTAYIQRTVHLGFALTLIFLLFPASKKATISRRKVPWYDYLLALLAILVTGYWPYYYEELTNIVGAIGNEQIVIGFIAVLLVLEATRRAVGLPITIIASIFLLYAYFGPYLPGEFGHRGLSLNQLMKTMYFSTEGILGTPISVSATYIFLFLLFGSFLVQTGVGNYFNDLAIALAGKRTGGPAKVAIFSSALNGTISGSSVANTVTTGSYTIPLMKRLGYHRNFAGAVEAASSTGGQIMPPIMGAAAFLMIDFAGVSYWTIAKGATIPAILFFTGIWIMTHFEAKKLGLTGIDDEELPDKKEVLKKLYLLIPILAIIWFLFDGVSIPRTALLGVLITIIVSLFRKDTNLFLDENGKFTIWKFMEGLRSGARTALGVAAATASAGMIVGVVTKTGLGIKLGGKLIGIARAITDNPEILLILTLFFTMIASLILGMGSPTTANYIITSTIALSPILALNEQLATPIPDLAGHMFVFYFGILADITPPVALAAFAATGISGGEPIRTGVNASRLAIAAFIIPYMFVLRPEMLMINATAGEIILILITSVLGMIGIGAAMIGYWYRQINWFERVIALIGGLLMIYPGTMTDIIGLAIFVGMIALQFIFNRDMVGKKVERVQRSS